MQQVLLKLWDDKVFRETGDKTEATKTIVFEYHGARYKLDLCDANAGEFDRAMKPWVQAAQRADAPPNATAGFKAGSKDSRDFYAGMRAWADSVGRSEEYMVRHRGPGPHKVNYGKPQKLVDDYIAHLASQAKAA